MRTASVLPALKTFAALALACAALQPLTAAAQSQPCTAIENDADRLACYDRALRPAPAPAPKASAAATVAPAATAPTSSVATEDRASRRERKARESAAPAVASAAPAAPAGPAAVDPIAPAPAPAPRAAAAAPATAEATRTRRTGSIKEATPAILPVVIVEIHALPGRAATFISDKGDAWVQTDNQHSQYPQTPFNASIEPGAMSSFFLVPTDRGRAIRVRPQ